MSGTVDLKLEVIAIPVSDVDRAKGFYGGLGWTLDADFMVGKDFRAVQLTPPGSPHMVVLEPGLRVYKIYNGYWFFGRPTVEELRLDLRAVLQRCRPDWDISSAEQRAAWEKGDKATFYPYGKTQAQVLADQD